MVMTEQKRGTIEKINNMVIKMNLYFNWCMTVPIKKDD